MPSAPAHPTVAEVLRELARDLGRRCDRLHRDGNVEAALALAELAAALAALGERLESHP